MKSNVQRFNQLSKEYYILFMLILLMFRAIGPYSLLPSIVDNLLYAAGAIFGSIIILIDLVNIVRGKKKWNYNWWLIGFLVVIFISSIVNRRYGITGNIKLLVWQSIYFLVVYEVAQDNEIFPRLIKKFTGLLTSVWFVLALVSLIVFFFQYSYTVHLQTRSRFLRIGFYEGRLFGVFEDPNFGSTVCVVVIILSFAYLVRKSYGNKWLGLLLKINIILQFLYIVLSGSRTGVLVLISVFFVYSFFKVFYSKRINKQHVLVKFLCAILLSLVGCGIIYLSVDLFKWILSYIPELFNEVKTKNPVKEKPVDLTRPDVENNDDISNGRLALWKSGIELFKSSWLVGVSPRNMLPYASDMLPQTFIAKTQKYTHNSYINLLASTGSLGVVTFVSFFVSRIIEIVAFSFSKVNNFFQQGYATYVLSVLAVAVSGMFLNDIILVNSIGSLIFWLFLGRIVYLSKEFK